MLLSEARRIAKGRYGDTAFVEVVKEGSKFVARMGGGRHNSKLSCDGRIPTVIKTSTASSEQQALNLLFR